MRVPPSDPPTSTPRSAARPLNRLQAGLEILLAALLGQLLASLAWASLISSQSPLASTAALFAFQMIDSLVTLIAIACLLRLNGQSWQTIGWRRKRSASGILVGIAAVPLLFGIALMAMSAIARLVPELTSGSNPMLELIQTPQDIVFLSASSLLAAGFKEEIQRAFILERFECGLGGAWIGLPTWSLFFGLMHWVQGPDRAIAAAFLGLAFGLLYLWRRHLAAPICAHSLYDVAVVLLTWWGR